MYLAYDFLFTWIFYICAVFIIPLLAYTIDSKGKCLHLLVKKESTLGDKM